MSQRPTLLQVFNTEDFTIYLSNYKEQTSISGVYNGPKP